ncbi:MAG: hypothetical protein UV40_C0039G0003 [Parcubacteria group bacterium GW2011_GWA1_42_7]|nr:MAG: hypothetical protein UV40_C0039G0003 [Parcubacteria group bacterium GW2011_GWA1_42_7]
MQSFCPSPKARCPRGFAAPPFFIPNRNASGQDRVEQTNLPPPFWHRAGQLISLSVGQFKTDKPRALFQSETDKLILFRAGAQDKSSLKLCFYLIIQSPFRKGTAAEREFHPGRPSTFAQSLRQNQSAKNALVSAKWSFFKLHSV